jgi:phage/plasmid-like protein (TIGR03299 family)
MSHEITQRENGLAEALYANTPAWHKLGQLQKGLATAAECLASPEQGGAGLDWKVKQQIMGRFVHAPERIDEWVADPKGYVEQHGDPWLPCTATDNEGNSVYSVKANVREDNGLYLGNVSQHYRVVQNTEAFSFMDALVDDGQMMYEAAFSLSGGKKVCMLGRVPGVDSVVPGDEQLRYILMTLCHDGSGAVKFGPTSVRVVCANTYRLAIEGSGSKVRELSIRHSGDIMEKLAEAREILSQCSARFDEFVEKGRELAQHRMSAQDWVTFLDIIAPEIPKEDPRYTDRRARAVADTREQIRLAYHDEKQDTAAGTAWAAFNAVSQHVDHLPRKGADSLRKAEARFNVCLYGTGHTHKAFALETLTRIAGLNTSA